MEDIAVDLSPLLPYTNENRWSDLLATLIRTDPQPLVTAGLLQQDACDAGILVLRECSVDRDQGRDRIDIMVRSQDGEEPLLAIECKVLSDIGHEQLKRYSTTHAAAEQVLLSLGHRHYDAATLDKWTSWFWKDLIEVFKASRHPWVEHTARSWLAYLASEDALDGTVTWGQLLPDSGNAIHDLQRKAAYLCARANNGFYLGSSNAGGKPLLVWRTPVPGRPGTYVMAEVEDAWSRRSFQVIGDRIDGAGGVVAFLGVRREYDDDDEIQFFDVNDLVTMWKVLSEDEQSINWSHHRPGKKIEQDRQQFEAHWERKSLPAYMGKGYRGPSYCEYGLKTKRVGADQSLDDIGKLLSRLSAEGTRIVKELAR